MYIIYIYTIQSTIKYKIASWLTTKYEFLYYFFFQFFIYCDNAAVVPSSAEEYIKENAPIDTDAYKKLTSSRYYKGIFFLSFA